VPFTGVPVGGAFFVSGSTNLSKKRIPAKNAFFCYKDENLVKKNERGVIKMNTKFTKKRRKTMNEVITILSSDGKQKGTVINWDAKKCTMEGCKCYKASVRWEDGTLTYPCHGGLNFIEKGVYKII